MMGNSVFLLFAFLLSCASFEATEVLRDCVKQDACHCKIDDYERIDISNALDKSPLKDQDSEFTYYFVGCADATINSTIFNSTLTKNYTGSVSMNLYLHLFIPTKFYILVICVQWKKQYH